MPTTRWPGSATSTTMAGHSRVQSSLRLAVRNLRPAVGQAVLDEVQGPALVGGDRAPGARRDTAPALLPAAPTDCGLLLLIEAVDELVVGRETLPTQQLVQPAAGSRTGGAHRQGHASARAGAHDPAHAWARVPPSSARYRSACRRGAATARAPLGPSPPPAAALQASPVFCQQTLERLIVEHGVGQELLEAAFPPPERSGPFGVGAPHPAVLRSPFVKGRRRDTVLSAKFCQLRPRLVLS